MPGPGFWVIGPSRSGYFGSSLPDGATPAGQADAYALLLDHLGISRAVVLGFSAGSSSALEFGLRHPDRVIGLIPANCRLGGGVTVSKAFAPVFRLAYGADRLFWVFKKLMPAAFSRMMGAPKGYRPASDEEARVMAGVRELLFPLRPRREGAVFDGFVSNLAADRFPLEQLAVPTLVISARDDPLAPYRYAARAASRIPGARLVTIEGVATCSSGTMPRCGRRSARSWRLPGRGLREGQRREPRQGWATGRWPGGRPEGLMARTAQDRCP
jgi:pimeloyl-ACP methyl ester carboxylesterase